MKTELNKNDLTGALSALGKHVSRTSPIEAYRCIQIEAAENKLYFRTSSSEGTIEFTMKAAMEESFSIVLNFEEFRSAVRGCRNRSLELEYRESALVVDNTLLGPCKCEFPSRMTIPENVKTQPLPENFVELLNLAAPVINRNDPRKVLQGINLSRDGITAANGKELVNVPVSLEVENLTIPFPMALLASKASGEASLCCWTDGTGIFFQIRIGCWCWTGKAVAGTYPNWKNILPERKQLIRSVSFTGESAESLKTWLKSVPDDPPNNVMKLDMGNGSSALVRSFKAMETNIPAEFSGEWGEYTLFVNRDVLLRLLNEGHTRIECQDGHGPFMASGGIGQYIAMPLYQMNTETKKEPVKEESEMNETNTQIEPAAVQTVTQNNEAAEASPLEDLSASIEAFKLKLKVIFEESNTLSRKVKEVALNQKQKERDFILAKRAIDRIRMMI